jgi:DNA polymerase eta
MPQLRSKSKSRFTYKNLLDLNDPARAYLSPLAVICHIDLNAFFAQCEQQRLGLSDDAPVVCVQWNTLIAVSYAAREYGITRMDRLEQAKLKCPDVIAAHTAVFKKGEPFWKYRDYLPSPINHKVSLDPYRREGKKVLNVFRDECDLVEKASVDESFMDLGRLVFKKVMELFPDLLDAMESTTDYMRPLKELPEGLDYNGYVIGKRDEAENGSAICDETQNFLVEDWDDLVMMVGSMICYDLRKKVEQRLGYKTSGGVGRVKTLAKLASGFKKPDQQTIVRNDAIPNFLRFFKLSDFWSFGGKLGGYVVEKLGDDMSIAAIRDNYDTPAKLSKLLDNNLELARRLYQIVRGELAAEIEEKNIVKTMASNKNFRGKSVCNAQDFLPWIDVFIGELVMRNEELDEEYNTSLRPTKLTIAASNAKFVRHSKQCTINQPPKDYHVLKELYRNLTNVLLKDLEKMFGSDTQMYPLINASVSVSTFIDISSVNTLDSLMSTVHKRKLNPSDVVKEETMIPIQKRRKNNIIDTFFMERKAPTSDSSLLSEQPLSSDTPSQKLEEPPNSEKLQEHLQLCPDCGNVIDPDDREIHKDYHLAISLDMKLNKEFNNDSYGYRLLSDPSRKQYMSKGKGKAKKTSEKSQTKLPFSR